VRVVSLLPAATEMLAAVGGLELLVGRSHECDWPPAAAEVPVVTARRTVATGSAAIDREVRTTLAEQGAGSLFELDAHRLRELKPDVVLTQQLCPLCAVDLDAVRSAVAPLLPRPAVVALGASTIEDVFDEVLRVGEAVGRGAAAEKAVVELRERYWTAVDYVTPFLDGPTVALLEWIDPPYVGGHWTPQLIAAAGGRPVLSVAGAASRPITPGELVDAAPQRLIVCPCGYDLAATERELGDLRKTAWWDRLPAVRGGRVALVDGRRMFSRPGPSLVEAFRWLVGWINDRAELVDAGFPWREA
jgi:ABC-type Fe3+-hydroxamate transport system substrate-binding protein